jgi:hypothetical protein
VWRPAWRRGLVWVPPGLLAATAAYVVAKQVRYDLPPSIAWPNEFEVTHAWGWAAVAAAAVLAVAGQVLAPATSAGAATPGEEGGAGP